MNQLPPANWYADPDNAEQWRYWDGQSWTDNFAPRSPAPPPPDPATAAPTEVAEVEVVEATVSRVEKGVAFAQTVFARREKRKVQVDREPSIERLLAGLQREAPRHPLDEQDEVAGETYHVKGIKKVFAEAGVPISAKGSTLDDLVVTLVPEPWNPYDVNAVAVVVGQHQVGHLPADLAADYAGPLGDLARRGFLATGEARIWALSDGGVIRARVTILIPESTAIN